MSPSVVLVLKLVSTTHVKPTTGIVVSDNGLVLVAADFISTPLNPVDTEIVVLDGGTDILSHGRPAKIITRSGPGGLAVLSVEGLKRPSITLSEQTSGDADDSSAESDLHLTAFPPAQYIAKGAEPLWVPVSIFWDELNARVSISLETPLPNVSGAIIDDCGYLAGISLAQGTQSLDLDKNPATLFNNEFGRALDASLIKLPRAVCGGSVTKKEISAGPQANDNKIIRDTSLKKAEQETNDSNPVTVDTQAQAVPKQSAVTPASTALDSDKPANSKTTNRPSQWSRIPLWLAPLGVIILTVLIWKGISFYRIVNNDTKKVPKLDLPSEDHPVAAEPDTAQLQTGSDSNRFKPRSVPLDVRDVLDTNTLPHGSGCAVVIEGLLDADTRFKRMCVVSTEPISIVIGRGEADINIEHPAISRAHARLECDVESMSLSDLGSSNGTFIRGMPCLAGEIMFFEPEDEIFMGTVQFHISIIRKETETS